MGSFLTLDNVSFTFHSKNGETEAIKNLNLNVSKGEFFGIVGPSGCGKTTILSLISGLLKPTKGKITLENNEILKPTNEVGYMLQKDELFEWRKVIDNVLLGLEITHTKTNENISRAHELLEKYGLGDFKNKYPNELSGGMRQRVALIRTLILSPKILLLDEPFSALDFQTRLNVCNDILDIIKQFNKTVIFVTHDISEAISMCDKIAVLTLRPASVKNIYDIDIDKNLTPLERREDIKFATYFDKIWKELQN